jgi:hypothetical protein
MARRPASDGRMGAQLHVVQIAVSEPIVADRDHRGG